MVSRFIPVEGNENEIWYMDTSNLTLTDLIQLKKELNGNKVNSISAIDAVIHNELGYEYSDIKSIKRENKRLGMPLKKSKNYKKRFHNNGR